MTASPRIVIQPYDERWPAEFATVERRLAEALGEALSHLAVRIDHIGSTSVPGLVAKGIIDIQVSVADVDDPRLRPVFERLGATPTDTSTDHVPPQAALGGTWPAATVLARTEWVNSNKDTVQKIVNALVATMHWIHSHSAAQIADAMPATYVENDLVTKADYITASTRA